MVDLPANSVALLGLAYSVAASYVDLRERRIPNYLSYSFLALAAALATLGNKLDARFAAGVALAFAFAYSAYRIGVWAGGDAKFFTVVNAYYFLAVSDASVFSFASVFLNSVVALVPVMLFAYWKKIKSANLGVREKLFRATKLGLWTAAATAVLSEVLSILSSGTLASGEYLAWVALTSFSFAFVFSFGKTVFPVFSQKVLRKTKKVSELKEGDVPAQSVVRTGKKIIFWEPPSLDALVKWAVQGNASAFASLGKPAGETIADCMAARGLSAGEITKLKQAGVKHLRVRESIAFAPIVALGFALSLYAPWRVPLP